MKRLSLSFALLLVAACAGSDKSADEPTATPKEHGPCDNCSKGEGHEHGGEAHAHGPHGDHAGHGSHGDHAGHGAHGGAHEHNFPAPVMAFHDSMGPLWHAEAGDERSEKTCAAIADFKTKAEGIKGAEVPAEAAEKGEEWAAAAQGLIDQVGALEAACAADGRPDFEASFKKLHQAFHTLVALVGHKEQ